MTLDQSHSYRLKIKSSQALFSLSDRKSGKTEAPQQSAPRTIVVFFPCFASGIQLRALRRWLINLNLKEMSAVDGVSEHDSILQSLGDEVRSLPGGPAWHPAICVGFYCSRLEEKETKRERPKPNELEYKETHISKSTVSRRHS